MIYNMCVSLCVCCCHWSSCRFVESTC